MTKSKKDVEITKENYEENKAYLAKINAVIEEKEADIEIIPELSEALKAFEAKLKAHEDLLEAEKLYKKAKDMGYEEKSADEMYEEAASLLKQMQSETDTQKAEKLYAKKTQMTFFSQPLTVKFVYNQLRKLATITGSRSTARKISNILELLSSASGKEAKYTAYPPVNKGARA